MSLNTPDSILTGKVREFDGVNSGARILVTTNAHIINQSWYSPEIAQQLLLDSTDRTNRRNPTNNLAREFGWNGEDETLFSFDEGLRESSGKPTVLIAAALNLQGQLIGVRSLRFLGLPGVMFNSDAYEAALASIIPYSGVGVVHRNYQRQGIGKDLLEGLFLHGMGDLRRTLLSNEELFINSFLTDDDRERFEGMDSVARAAMTHIFGIEGLVLYRMATTHGVGMIESTTRTLERLGVTINPEGKILDQSQDFIEGTTTRKSASWEPVPTSSEETTMTYFENRSPLNEPGMSRINTLTAFINGNVPYRFIKKLAREAAENPDYRYVDARKVAIQSGIPRNDVLQLEQHEQIRRMLLLKLPFIPKIMAE